MTTANTHAPLSLKAKNQLNDGANAFLCFIVWIFCILIGMTPCIIVGVTLLTLNLIQDPTIFWVISIYIVVPLSFAPAIMFFHWSRHKDILENDLDYERSLKLMAAWQKTVSLTPEDFQQADDEIAGLWQPFRVEHYVSSSFHPSFPNLASSVLNWPSHRYDCEITPNLIDASAVIYLRDAQNNTLRLLLPSLPATIKLLNHIFNQKGQGIGTDSHTDLALQKFFSLREKLAGLLSHAQLIDSIDVACRQLAGQPPALHVYGKIIQPGVAIGTQIKTNGETAIFLPTRFLDTLADTIGQIIEPPAKAPLVVRPAA